MFTTVKRYKPNFASIHHSTPSIFLTTKPAVNIREDDNSILLDIAVPGFSKDHFDIEIHDSNLTIKPNSTDEQSSENQKLFCKREFDYSKFMLTYRLSDKIDSENISAQYHDGILSVILAKKKEIVNKILIK